MKSQAADWRILRQVFDKGLRICKEVSELNCKNNAIRKWTAKKDVSLM